MKLKRLIRPDSSIPDAYREEWLSTVFNRIKIRLNALLIAMFSAMLLVNFLSYKLNRDLFVFSERLPRIIVLAIMMCAVAVLSFRSRTLKQIKLTALIAVLMILMFFTSISLLGFMNGNPLPFGSLVLISVFFVGLMIPWTIRELLGISFMHLIFNAVYYHLLGYIRTDQLQAAHYFEPFLETFLLTAAAILFCLSIRYQEIVKDVRNFILLKDTEIQKQKIEALNRQVSDELVLASRVQQTLIPEPMTDDRVSTDILYLPVSEIGGDYAATEYLDKNRMLALICDVTGHGIPAALIVSRIHAEFKHILRPDIRPDAVLKRLNVFIQKNFPETGMMLSAFCILFDFSIRQAEYCSYGHPDQLHVSGNGTVVSGMKSQAGLIGIESTEEVFGNNSVSFTPSDRFILFTDGLAECRNMNGEDYGDREIFNFIRNQPSSSPSAFSLSLLHELNGFKSEEFKDDIFVLNILIK